MGNIATKLASKSTEFQNLFLGQFPEQQLKAGNSDKYYQTLTDFDFISRKTANHKFGVEALIRDYELIENAEILEKLEEDEKLEPAQVETLKLIQRALQLSSHILNEDKNQLVGQLWGRLQSIETSDIQKILADAAASKSENPRLRPITASLTTPGGNLLRTLTGHNSGVNAVRITPDGKKAISGSSDSTLKLWDLETGKVISTLRGHNNSVKIAVSGSFDKMLKLWDLKTGKEISILKGHNDSVRAVAISPDDQKAVSASADETLKLWNLKTGNVISNFIGDSSINCCAIAPDGLTIVAGEQSGRVHFLRLEGGDIQ